MSNDPPLRKFKGQAIALFYSSCNMVTSKSMDDVLRFDLDQNKRLRTNDILLAERERAKTELSSYCAVLAFSWLRA